MVNIVVSAKYNMLMCKAHLVILFYYAIQMIALFTFFRLCFWFDHLFGLILNLVSGL